MAICVSESGWFFSRHARPRSAHVSVTAYPEQPCTRGESQVVFRGLSRCDRVVRKFLMDEKHFFCRQNDEKWAHFLGSILKEILKDGGGQKCAQFRWKWHAQFWWKWYAQFEVDFLRKCEQIGPKMVCSILVKMVCSLLGMLTFPFCSNHFPIIFKSLRRKTQIPRYPWYRGGALFVVTIGPCTWLLLGRGRNLAGLFFNILCRNCISRSSCMCILCKISGP